MNKKYYIYKIINVVNDRIYIGCTSQRVIRRGYAHSYNANKGGRSLLHKAIKKYGSENFTITKIKTCFSELEGLKYEKIFIKKYDSYKNGYNSTLGGSGFPKGVFNHTEETKNKMSLSHKGKKFTKEHKRKIGEAHRGKKLSDITKEKLSKIQKQLNQTEEHKKKLSLAQMGNKNGIGNKGNKHSEESKRKMSMIKIGKKFSKETKKKMSEARKNYWKKIKSL